MTPDPSNVERRSSWRDEHLDCICGLANGRGGVLEIGREVRREAIGVTDLLRLADEIPNKVQVGPQHRRQCACEERSRARLPADRRPFPSGEGQPHAGPGLGCCRGR